MNGLAGGSAAKRTRQPRPGKRAVGTRLEVGRPHERLATLRAIEGPFASVCAQMLLQVAGLCELLPAGSAPEGL